MKLVDNAKLWWKMNTVQFWIFVGMMPEILAQLSDDVKDYLPGPVRAGASIIAAYSIFLRLRQQPGLKKE